MEHNKSKNVSGVSLLGRLLNFLDFEHLVQVARQDLDHVSVFGKCELSSALDHN